MYNLVLDENESGIANPLKEDGDITPHPEVRNPHAYPEDVHVNINVNTDDIKKASVNEDAENNRDKDRVDELHAILNRNLPVGLTTADPNSYYFVANEDISGFIKNTFSSVINTLGHITNLFKTAVFNGWRDFKRSELKEYTESNVASVFRIRRMDYYAIRNINLDIPNGMKTSYLKSVKSLLDCLNAMDMPTRSKVLYSSAEKILSSLRNGNAAFASAINDASRDYADSKNVERLFYETEKHFTTQTSIKKATYEKAFESLAGFNQVLDDVLDAEDNFTAVAMVNDRLKDLEQTIGYIGDSESINDMSRSSVDSLAKIVRSWAFLFEKYSIIINDLYRVNHNLVYNLEDLRKNLK